MFFAQNHPDIIVDKKALSVLNDMLTNVGKKIIGEVKNLPVTIIISNEEALTVSD